MTFRMIRTLPALAVAVLLAACAGGETFGDRLAAEGGEIAAIGQQWSQADEAIAEGHDLIEKGNKQIDQGENLVAKGRKNIRRGEKLVARGQRDKQEAEQAYRQRNPTVDPLLSSG